MYQVADVESCGTVAQHVCYGVLPAADTLKSFTYA